MLYCVPCCLTRSWLISIPYYKTLLLQSDVFQLMANCLFLWQQGNINSYPIKRKIDCFYFVFKVFVVKMLAPWKNDLMFIFFNWYICSRLRKRKGTHVWLCEFKGLYFTKMYWLMILCFICRNLCSSLCHKGDYSYLVMRINIVALNKDVLLCVVFFVLVLATRSFKPEWIIQPVCLGLDPLQYHEPWRGICNDIFWRCANVWVLTDM